GLTVVDELQLDAAFLAHARGALDRRGDRDDRRIVLVLRRRLAACPGYLAAGAGELVDQLAVGGARCGLRLLHRLDVGGVVLAAPGEQQRRRGQSKNRPPAQPGGHRTKTVGWPALR